MDATQNSLSTPDATGLRYAESRRMDLVETLHGVAVADPYRWLEDLDSDETAAWVAAQNEVTFGYLDTIPERAGIRERIEKLWDYPRYEMPFIEGGRTFVRHNDGLQNQSVLYVLDEPDAEPRVLIDPNTLSSDGTVALGEVSVSPDGSKLAYAVQASGSDWIEWRVRDVETGVDLPDVITWSKFSTADWSRDGRGFYYSHYDAPVAGREFEATNTEQKLYFHVIGTAQADDRLVLSDPDHPDHGFHAKETRDGRFLVVRVWKGTFRTNLIWYRETGSDGPFVKLLDDNDAEYAFLGSFAGEFWFRTSRDAPRGRVIAIDVENPETEHWREVIPQSEDTLRSADLVGRHVICSYLHNAHSRTRVFTRDGAHVRDVEFPGIGTADGFRGKPDDPASFYVFTGFTTPATIYRYDVDSGETSVFRETQVDVDTSRYETSQVFYELKDGTRVSMFLTHRKGLTLDGMNPTYLYGYGGFNIPLTPAFSVAMTVWMDMGGVYAVANLRGGGEYGDAWHAAGTKERKQNVFDDFIAAAEWLIAEGYTTTPKLAIMGGSNGGLLVGACMTQRPDLFGACIPAVGVLDVLRFHRFTIGWAWVSDYGDPDDPAAFEVLLKYSPYHNLVEGRCYPPTLIMTSDHDDRVVPSHSFKFAAELQRTQGCDNPCLIRVETSAGHGAGKPTSKVIDEIADRFAFLVRVLEIDVE